MTTSITGCHTVIAALAVFIVFNPHVVHADSDTCISETDDVAYFRRLAAVDSLAEPIRGIMPLDAAQAENIAHFRISRDGCGAVKDVSYFHGDKRKPIDENFAGNIFTPVSQAVFDRDGVETSITFFDHAGESATVYGNVSTINISHNAEGKITSARFLSADGTLAPGPAGYALAQWRWSNNDRAQETRYDDNENRIIAGASFKYSDAIVAFGPHGMLSQIEINGPGPVIRYEHHSDGSLKAWRAFGEDGAPETAGAANVHGADYSYDDNGYLIRLKYLDVNGRATLSAFGHKGFTRQYAENGNRLNYFFADAADNIWTPPQRGYAGQRFFWRNDGVVRTKTEYVDSAGVRQNHPQRNYAAIHYVFDSDDRIVRRLFLDSGERLLYARTP